MRHFLLIFSLLKNFRSIQILKTCSHRCIIERRVDSSIIDRCLGNNWLFVGPIVLSHYHTASWYWVWATQPKIVHSCIHLGLLFRFIAILRQLFYGNRAPLCTIWVFNIVALEVLLEHNHLWFLPIVLVVRHGWSSGWLLGWRNFMPFSFLVKHFYQTLELNWNKIVSKYDDI